MVANAAPWVLPVTAGTVVSTAHFPPALRALADILPGTWTVRSVRAEVPLWLGLSAEVCVGLGWLLIAVLALRRAERRHRMGISDSLPI